MILQSTRYSIVGIVFIFIDISSVIKEMAFVSFAKSLQMKSRVFDPFITSLIHPYSLFFNSSRFMSNVAIDFDEIGLMTEPSLGPRLISAKNSSTDRENRTYTRRIRAEDEKTEDIICRMMANRSWTTRLQNSIRRLAPEFDHSLVLQVLRGSRNYEHALQFFRWAERTGFQHDQATHIKIIEILTNASKLNHARCILMDMPKKGIEWNEDMFIMLITAYGKSGIVQESVKVFEKMKELGVDRTCRSYDALFKAITRRGRYMMAKRFFNSMCNEGISPSVYTYNLLIWGFFLCLKVNTANRFFTDMKNRGVLPNEVTYNTIVHGYVRVKKIDKAEKAFAEMRENGISPTVIGYNTLIKGYISVGRVEDSLRMLYEMPSLGIYPDSVTFSTMLPRLCDLNKMKEAQSVFKQMVERHITPKDNSIFMTLISLNCQSNSLDAAFDVFRAMTLLKVPLKPEHFGVLIENFCRVGMQDRAVRLLDRLLEKDIILKSNSNGGMEPAAYNPIIAHLCENGSVQKAETFFRQLMKKGVQDAYAFNNLIRGHSREGTPERAFEIMKIMGRKGLPREVDCYNMLIESFLRKGEPADAKMVLDDMIESGHVPESGLFRSVMDALFADERVQTASRVMRSMIEKGLKDNMDLVAKIVEALLMRGHIEEAIGRIDLLISSGCTLDFDVLISVLCKKQKTYAALKLLDFCLMKSCDIDFSSSDKVIDHLLASGKTLNAYSIFIKIINKGGVTNLSSYEELIRGLNEGGNTKQADVLSRMITKYGKDRVRKKESVNLHARKGKSYAMESSI